MPSGSAALLRGEVEAVLSGLAVQKIDAEMIKSYNDVVKALLPPADRPDVLKALLPPIDSPYCVDSLNPAETAALEEALCDCFGSRGFGSTKCGEVENGLLHFSRFQTDYFKSHPEEVVPPFEGFPIKFKMGGLWPFFKNQRDRYCEYLAREEPDYGTSIIEIIARGWEFKKPWYEYHAVQLLEWIAGGIHPIGSLSGWHLAWCGQLGRLVEQYYWKFRYEKDAVTGIGARKGASLSGKLKSERHKARQAEWQRSASEIWSVTSIGAKRPLLKTSRSNSVNPGLPSTSRDILENPHRKSSASGSQMRFVSGLCSLCWPEHSGR